MGAYSNLTWQLLVQFLIVLFLVVAVSGLAVGFGLIASSPKIVGYFHTLNRWVSTRHVLRPVEVPVDTERATHRHHRWLAVGFVLGGLISIRRRGVRRKAFRAGRRHSRGKRKVGSDRGQRARRRGRRDAALLPERGEHARKVREQMGVVPPRDSKLGRHAHEPGRTRRGPSQAGRLDHRLHLGGGGDLRSHHAGALLLTRASAIRTF